MPTVYNKIVIDGVTKIDLSQDTVTEAGHILTGHTGHLANGNQVPGTGSGGSNAYTRTQILPVQTFTPDSSNKRATLTGLSEGFVDAGYYIVTYDNEEWIVTCEVLWTNNYAIGEGQFFLNTSEFESADPFGIVWVSGTNCTIAIGDTNQHTIKIEKLTFDGDPILLAQKSIAANGTYNASSDNADGYSSVTVNVPTGVDIPIFTIIRNSETEEITSITCNKTFAECDTLAENEQGIVCADNYFGTDFSYRTSGNVYMLYDNRIAYLVDSYFTEITFNNDGTITWVEPSSHIKDSSSLTVSGATVTVPAGLYSTQATKSVASGSAGTPTASKGTVSNHSITVTPSVTNTTGYITGGTKTGTGVTVSASELASGNKAIVDNGTNIDVVGYSTVSVAVPFSTITVNSSNPSGGSNGDIWIKTS